MKNLKLKLLFVALLCCATVAAQDLLLSEFGSGPSVEQPTFTGFVKDSGFDDVNYWYGYYVALKTNNGNRYAYNYENVFGCYQEISDLEEGFYKLSANACGLEYYYDRYEYYYYSRELPVVLFLDGYEKSIPNAFSEAAESDIYNGTYEKREEGYFPTSREYMGLAFSQDMYKVTLYGYIEPDSTNTHYVGIYCDDDAYDKWAAWDNIILSLVEEEELDSMLNKTIEVYNALMPHKYEGKLSESLKSLLNEANTATTYKEKALALSKMQNLESVLRMSIESYENLLTACNQLKEKLEGSVEFISPATLAEAKAYSQEILAAYNSATFTNEDIANVVSKVANLITRLNYTYLDINVTDPGILGDLILEKVENFTDVYSLKISGTINADDVYNLKNRLTNLREIDMSGVNMVTLENRTFEKRSLLEKVVLPSNLQSIGDYAFYECTNLKSIEFPTGLKMIGARAFYSCKSIETLIIPEGVEYVGSYAFFNNANLKYVKLPSTLTTISSNTFEDDINLTTVEFSEGLDTIEENAFDSCKSLDNIEFPNSLRYIGWHAFYSNSELKNIKFNEGLYSIADNAFIYCKSLTEVTLPSTLVYANESPFDYCDNLMKVTCLSIEPPYIEDQIPYGCSMEGRELYVPALSINTYKQTTGWDKFPTIKPIDHLPETITILDDIRLTLPETLPSDYKPSVKLIRGSKNNRTLFGKLTVYGSGTLSMSSLNLAWDADDYYSGYTAPFTSLINNSHLRADDISITFCAKNNNWTFVSFPFDVNVSEIETEGMADGTTNWIIRKYDSKMRAEGETNNTWVKMTNDSILHAGEGYIIQGSRYVGNSSKDYSYFLIKAVNNINKNNIFRSTDVIVDLKEYQSEFAHNRSWNFIGNPYPSFYDTRFMDFAAPITLWNWDRRTYEAYSPIDDNYILAPGEAFFVQRPLDRSSITFSKEGRQNNMDIRSLDAPAKAPSMLGTNNRTVINISISNGESSDRTRIVLNEGARYEYEVDKDAAKFMSTDTSVPQIYTIYDGVDYAINERPLGEGSVCLSTYFGANGLYTIALQNEVKECTVYLEDKLTGKMVELTPHKAYEFYAESGTEDGRFLLHFENGTNTINAISNDNIEKDYYSIDGVKIENPTRPGIYIQKDKKVIVK